jgi:hypothetical protein
MGRRCYQPSPAQEERREERTKGSRERKSFLLPSEWNERSPIWFFGGL